MIEQIKEDVKYTKKELSEVNPLNLAFIGDAIWTLMVREFFCNNTKYKNNNLHKLTTKFVKAVYQAEALEKLQQYFTEDELDIARRARNTKINTACKNATLADYKKATSFEAVIGYLYLLGNIEKIKQLFSVLQNDFLEAIK